MVEEVKTASVTLADKEELEEGQTSSDEEMGKLYDEFEKTKRHITLFNRLDVGFVGLGKLGKIAAETINEYHVVFGYDINPDI